MLMFRQTDSRALSDKHLSPALFFSHARIECPWSMTIDRGKVISFIVRREKSIHKFVNRRDTEH